MAFSRRFLTSFGSLVNIAPNEWVRVIFAWFLRFFWQISSMMGFTILTVLTVDRFGITNLPYFYIVHGLLIVFGGILYSRFIHRFNKGVVSSILALMTALFYISAAFLQDSHIFLFLGAAMVAFSVLLPKLQVVLSLFIEELFSPSESERTLPVIESAETIGGIVAGLILALLVSYMEPESMFLISGIIASFVVLIFVGYSLYSARVPRVRTLDEKHKLEKGYNIAWGARVKQSFSLMRKNSFLRGLAALVVCQWMVFTLIQFQFTNAVTSEIEVRGQEFIAQEGSGTGASFIADITRVFETNVAEEIGLIEKDVERIIEDDLQGADSNLDEVKIFRVGEEAPSVKLALTQGLGVLHVIFSTIALVMQLFFASRIIGRLGIINSMIVYVVTSFFAAFGMLLNYSFLTASIARANDEVVGVLYRNSYHTSYYSLYEGVRDYVRHTFDGLIRPLGIILATVFLILLNSSLSYRDIIFGTNLFLIVISLSMFFVAFRMRKHHSRALSGSLDVHENSEAEFDAVELLAEPGHPNAHEILLKHLNKPHNDMMKVHILHALGRISHPETIPEILTHLEKGSIRVQEAALDALMKFKNLNTIYFEKIFTRHRILEVMKKLFIHAQSRTVRRKAIRFFEGIHDADVAEFLIHILESDKDVSVKADCIYVMGLFHDAAAAHYIEPYLNDRSGKVVVNAAIALWYFPKNRLRVLPVIVNCLDADNADDVLLGIEALGEIGAYHEIPRLKEYLKDDRPDLAFAASFALLKLGDASGLVVFVNGLVKCTSQEGLELFSGLDKIPDDLRARVLSAVEHKASEAINAVFSRYVDTYLSNYDQEDLQRLIYYFTLLGEHHEIMKVLDVLKVDGEAAMSSVDPDTHSIN